MDLKALGRFVHKIRYSDEENGCWYWTAYLDRKGYGMFQAGHSAKTRNFMFAHRYSYQIFKGSIGKGLHIDHLCRIPRCVNPQHLRAVTPKENWFAEGSRCVAKLNALKTHCYRGHPLTLENLVPTAKARLCLICTKERCKRWYYSAKGRANLKAREEQRKATNYYDRVPQKLTTVSESLTISS